MCTRLVSSLLLFATATATVPQTDDDTARLVRLLNPPADATPQLAPMPLLWLPLGDSITWGCGTDAKPRGGAGCVADAGG